MDISTPAYINYPFGFRYPPVPNATATGTTSFEGSTQTVDAIPSTVAPEQINPSLETDPASREGTQAESRDIESQNRSQTTTAHQQELTPAEIQLVEDLKHIDTEVRQHEMAHIAAGGKYITSGANLTYKRGPDGQNYAVAGEVGIDTSPVPGDPQATIQKMRQVKAAALAPATPSSQDLKVASNATSTATEALSDLMMLQAEEQAKANENKAFGNRKKAVDAYETINNLPEEAISTFQIAV